MDPVEQAVIWMLMHPAETAYDTASRQRFQEVHGPISQQEWNSAVGTAVYNRRVNAALDQAHGNAYIGTVLQGLVGGQGDVTVRFVIRGTDVFGFQHTSYVDVTVPRGTRMRDLQQMALDQFDVDYGLGTVSGATAELVGWIPE